MKFRLAPGLALAVACCLALTACSSYKVQMGWPPIYKKPAPVPEAVNELNLVNADGTPANFPQYWKRNTLVIDLSAIGAAGNFAARFRKAPPGRCASAFGCAPAASGKSRSWARSAMSCRWPPKGLLPIDLEFAPSVYTPRTAAIYISWGPDGGSRGRAFSAGVRKRRHSCHPLKCRSPAPRRRAGSASDIVKPAEAQPSPPPGS